MTVSEGHLEALKRAMELAEDRAARKLLRECLYELSTAVSRQVTERAMEVMREDLTEPVLETDDLKLLDRLIAMGVQQNGLVPVLSTLQVGRAIGILGNLLGRAHVSVLEQEQMELLEAIFDHAAEHDPVRKQVRELEMLVRGGLGLDQRVAWPQQELPLS